MCIRDRAYLTDAETATNTFTVGKVKIDLEEPGYPGNDSDEMCIRDSSSTGCWIPGRIT